MSTEMKELKVQPRTEFGSSASNRMRKKGLIPSVVYGREVIHVAVNASQFYHEFHGHISENSIINLQVGDRAINVLVKDFQSDILTEQIIHIDFLEVMEGHVLKTHVPLILDGVPIGVKKGGMLEHQCETIEVECLPKDLPSEFHMDIAHLKLGESMALSALEHDPAIRILSSMEQIVAHISIPRGLAAVEALDS